MPFCAVGNSLEVHYVGAGAVGEGVNIRIIMVERTAARTKTLFQWVRPFGVLW